jgi:hypothetical protein
MDNGPIEKSAVFRRAMEHLGIAVLPHLPAGKDGRRPTARSKGKVERPFRTVKEAHETLYHFHKPETEAEANRWLKRYLAQYNAQRHRAEAHSRIEDWLKNLPADGVREMCSCSTRISMSNSATSVTAPTIRPAAQFRCIITGSIARVGANSAPIALHSSPARCRCQRRCWKDTRRLRPNRRCRPAGPLSIPTRSASSPSPTASPPSWRSLRHWACRSPVCRRRNALLSMRSWPRRSNAGW